MDIQTYISSGILESYVLGLTSLEENQEIEALADEHEIIRQEIASIRGALEAYASQFAQTPPPSLKDKVMNRLDFLEAEENDSKASLASPFLSIEKTEEEDKETFISEDVIAYAENIQKQNRFSYWAVAASILLGFSILGNIYLFSQWKQTETQLAQITTERTELALHNQELEQKMKPAMMTASVVSNPDYKVVNLQTTDPKMNAEVILYWHPEKGNLYIAANKLPPLPKGKKYQLWAIVGDKKLDAGMFAPTQEKGLFTMKSIPLQAQAFAITLEDEQGSPEPTTNPYVVGKV
ncbi:anti-sigma factor [Xanthocytophaga flava]|uniref:anti-sigma factor n=1 Tax=Xanthocytophaga flava TaxID=3048013 RepID=UPI0028D770BF|nr:anti-sigma factor [Xanthocytophaga flavus]MDJ1473208.1 anti-sigma factor [Xanthocytophaga flavus]